MAGNHCALIDQHGVCELDPSQAGFAPDYTPVWRSTNGGRSYRWIADPLKAIESQASQRDAAGALGQDKPGGYESRPTGNAVSLEDEMLKVASNQMDYQAATALYTRGLALIKTALGKA